MTEIIGWASSIILLATLIKQVYKQWKEGTGEGVSNWLFIGQVFSSIGFTIYSYLVGNWVFTVTNAILLVNNFIGLGLTFYLKRKNRGDESKEA
jgi:MtN3 and saliva related transmembrane protein